ncbi:MAG: hypothetical protein AAB538_00775 [Patescibacteria group bacterium]
MIAKAYGGGVLISGVAVLVLALLAPGRPAMITFGVTGVVAGVLFRRFAHKL